MATFIALLRGVNVGGHNRLPMADLRASLERAGFDRVATYIQSGNVVLTAPSCDPGRIGAIIADDFGLDIPVVVRSADELRATVEANPFPEMASEPKRLHVFFCPGPVPSEALDAFDHAAHHPDQLATGDNEIYVAYHEGMGTSKLTNAVVDRLVGAPTTARNWTTVRKLVDLAGAADAADAPS